VDGRPNRTNKAAFSNSSTVVWMGPNTPYYMALDYGRCNARSDWLRARSERS